MSEPGCSAKGATKSRARVGEGESESERERLAQFDVVISGPRVNSIVLGLLELDSLGWEGFAARGG